MILNKIQQLRLWNCEAIRTHKAGAPLQNSALVSARRPGLGVAAKARVPVAAPPGKQSLVPVSTHLADVRTKRRLRTDVAAPQKNLYLTSASNNSFSPQIVGVSLTA